MISLDEFVYKLYSTFFTTPYPAVFLPRSNNILFIYDTNDTMVAFPICIKQHLYEYVCNIQANRLRRNEIESTQYCHLDISKEKDVYMKNEILTVKELENPVVYYEDLLLRYCLVFSQLFEDLCNEYEIVINKNLYHAMMVTNNRFLYIPKTVVDVWNKVL